MEIQPKDRIIAALDVSSEDEVRSLVATLAGHVGMFKIGLEALYALGMPRVKALLVELGTDVFIDCKLHDIPETMRKAALAIVGPHVAFFNAHATAGAESLQAAAKAKSSRSKFLAVTLLTSHSPEDVASIFNADHVERKVVSLAGMAMQNGADGIICSPKEIKAMREHPDTRHALLVTPSVRPAWASADDQKRVMTPAEAVRAGADYLVIGRPITNNKTYAPIEAAKRIAAEIEDALASI